MVGGKLGFGTNTLGLSGQAQQLPSWGFYDAAPALGANAALFSSYTFTAIPGMVIDAIYVVSQGNPSYGGEGIDATLSLWDAGLYAAAIDFSTTTAWSLDGTTNGIVGNDDHVTAFGAQVRNDPTLYGEGIFPYTLTTNHQYSVLVGQWAGINYGANENGGSGMLYIDYHVIPEPSTYALALGGSALGLSFWMRQRQKKLA